MKKLFTIYLANNGALQFHPEPGVEEMIDAHKLHDLIGDTIAEFGENYRHKNRLTKQNVGGAKEDVGRIIIPKGAIF